MNDLCKNFNRIAPHRTEKSRSPPADVNLPMAKQPGQAGRGIVPYRVKACHGYMSMDRMKDKNFAAEENLPQAPMVLAGFLRFISWFEG